MSGRHNTHCTDCGADLPADALGRYSYRRCVPCKAEYERGRARRAQARRRATVEQRRVIRRREYEANGKPYRTREELEAVQSARRAARDARVRPRTERTRQIDAWVARLINEDPGSATFPARTLRYRARYRYDDTFRAKEITRRQMVKTPAPDDGTLTPDVVRALFAAAAHCPYCGAPMPSRSKSLDHVVPRSRGGAHSVTNVVVCCRSCNSRKHARTPEEWLSSDTTIGCGSLDGGDLRVTRYPDISLAAEIAAWRFLARPADGAA